MKTNLQELEIIFIAATRQEAEKGYNSLRQSGKLEENLKIVPRYYVAGKGEDQITLKDDMILIALAELKNDFDKIRPDLKYFVKLHHRYLFSNNEEARTWVTELSDSGFKVLIGLKDETVLGLRDVLLSALPKANLTSGTGVKNC